MVMASPVASSPASEKPTRGGGLVALTKNKKGNLDVTQLEVEYTINEDDPNEEFGGADERKSMEKRLLAKLDMRYAHLLILS